MPQETIDFPAAYVVIGAYRLAHDPALWKPMWADISGAAKKAGIAAAAWGVITWPIQRAFVGMFMKSSSKVLSFSGLYSSLTNRADEMDNGLGFALPLPSLQGFATFMFVLSQCSTIMELWLRRRLRRARTTAYGETVKSRGKSADWWTDYYEEWELPPTERALAAAKRQSLYTRLATPLFRMVVLKVFLLPLDWVPFFSLLVSSFIRALSLGRQLHAPLFAAKRMTPAQVEVWMAERSFGYRQFGFAAALAENVPLVGIVLSISNRVGAAMFAHDLEKRQQLVRSGQRPKLSASETYSEKDPRKPSGPGPSRRVGAIGDGHSALPGDFTHEDPASHGQSSSAATATHHPSIPRPLDTAPPSYTESEAQQVVAGSASAAGGLGLAPSHAAVSGAEKRRVPAPPVPPRK
ncbi:unnamed protein product [Parajaminaea phylloscopi]